MTASGPKTYSHLAAERRIPSEYEIATSQLHYYVGRRGFEVRVPLADWYERYQAGSGLWCSDWERFRDPRETTYTRYTAWQQTKETQVEGVLHIIEQSGYDDSLPAECLDALERFVTPLRFLFHGFQMMAAYVGQMAPGGRITIAAALQAADEMRRIQRVAVRMGQLRRVRSTFGDSSREIWQRDPMWQPLRRCIEGLLVTYGWGEALAALNLCVKPSVDDFFMVEVPVLVKAHGDYKLQEIFFSLNEDSVWHRQWSSALVSMALKESLDNRRNLTSWVASWLPRAEEALVPFAGTLADGGQAAVARTRLRVREWLEELGVA